MIYFFGNTHAANHLRNAAIQRGVQLANSLDDATVIFLSEDTQTDDKGNRDLERIRRTVLAFLPLQKHLVLTSQVPPGFTRSFSTKKMFHQPETLRIKDAEERAFSPEYIAVGGEGELHPDYLAYLLAFKCPILRMSYEEAELSKIAVNMALAVQVDYTNRLSAAASKVRADWGNVARALHLDSRIGPNAYLTPGRWQDSKHLLRDFVTLTEIESR